MALPGGGIECLGCCDDQPGGYESRAVNFTHRAFARFNPRTFVAEILFDHGGTIPHLSQPLNIPPVYTSGGAPFAAGDWVKVKVREYHGGFNDGTNRNLFSPVNVNKLYLARARVATSADPAQVIVNAGDLGILHWHADWEPADPFLFALSHAGDDVSARFAAMNYSGVTFVPAGSGGHFTGNPLPDSFPPGFVVRQGNSFYMANEDVPSSSTESPANSVLPPALQKWIGFTLYNHSVRWGPGPGGYKRWTGTTIVTELFAEQNESFNVAVISLSNGSFTHTIQCEPPLTPGPLISHTASPLVYFSSPTGIEGYYVQPFLSPSLTPFFPFANPTNTVIEDIVETDTKLEIIYASHWLYFNATTHELSGKMLRAVQTIELSQLMTDEEHFAAGLNHLTSQAWQPAGSGAAFGGSAKTIAANLNWNFFGVQSRGIAPFGKHEFLASDPAGPDCANWVGSKESVISFPGWNQIISNSLSCP